MKKDLNKFKMKIKTNLIIELYRRMFLSKSRYFQILEKTSMNQNSFSLLANIISSLSVRVCLILLYHLFLYVFASSFFIISFCMCLPHPSLSSLSVCICLILLYHILYCTCSCHPFSSYLTLYVRAG